MLISPVSFLQGFLKRVDISVLGDTGWSIRMDALERCFKFWVSDLTGPKELLIHCQYSGFKQIRRLSEALENASGKIENITICFHYGFNGRCDRGNFRFMFKWTGEYYEMTTQYNPRSDEYASFEYQQMLRACGDSEEEDVIDGFDEATYFLRHHPEDKKKKKKLIAEYTVRKQSSKFRLYWNRYLKV